MSQINTGDVFGKLTVASKAGRDKYRRTMWNCSCECGATVQAATGELNYGHKQSCGCLKIGMLKTRVTKHGRYKTRTYSIWNQMKVRCHNPRHPNYHRYGGRGIDVCARWRESYPAFLSDMGEKPESLSIDRIDNDGGYWCGKPECAECGPLGRPPNCRWTDQATQTRNRSVCKKGK